MASLGHSRSSKRLKRTSSFISKAVAATLPEDTRVNLEQDRQIARLNRKVNFLAGLSETKEITQTVTNTGVGTGGAIYALDFVGQGDTSLTRSGLSIRPMSVEFQLVLESEFADSYNIMRMVICQSREGPLSVADFAGAGFPIGQVQKNAMTILYDQTFMLNNDHSGPASDPLSSTRYSFHHGKVKVPRAITYLDGNSNSSKNNLYVFFVSDSGLVAHPDVERFNSITTFKDN